MKACFVYRELDFPKSHEIGELIGLLEEYDKEIAGIKSEVDDLTPYAVMTRYPGTGGKTSLEDANEAIEIAKEVRKLVLKTIKL
ncbi:MAG: HEPN domain-containing protein [Leptospiraceae bacterium]|nr:HEPN domain-containing protein [Leptospiraceae bacterium]